MKHNTKRSWLSYILLFLFICLIFVWVFYNIKNNTNFWQASAANVITIVIAVLISFYLVQKKTDRRKQKDILLDLILKLRLQLESEETFDFSGQEQAEITMRNRDIGNKIQILKRTADLFGTQDDVKFIEEHFEEYRQLIDDHFPDLEYLSKSKTELKRPLELICNQLIEMAIGLYT